MSTRHRILVLGTAFLAALAAGAWFVVTQVLPAPMFSSPPDIRRAQQIADHTTVTGYRRIGRFDDNKFTLTDVYVGTSQTDPRAAVHGWNFALGPPLPSGTDPFHNDLGYANVKKPDYYDCSVFLSELTSVDRLSPEYGLSASDVRQIQEGTLQALGLDVVCGG